MFTIRVQRGADKIYKLIEPSGFAMQAVTFEQLLIDMMNLPLPLIEEMEARIRISLPRNEEVV